MNTILLLLLIYIWIFCLNRKENYKRQRRRGIRGGWSRRGKSGQTIALKGSRHPKWPTITDDRYLVADYDDIPSIDEMKASSLN